MQLSSIQQMSVFDNLLTKSPIYKDGSSFSLDQFLADHRKPLELVVATKPVVSVASPLLTNGKHNSNRGKKTEVFPFKDPAQIEALHHYLLNRAANAAPRYHNAFYRDWLFFTLSLNMGRRGCDTLSLKWSQVLELKSTSPLVYEIIGTDYNRLTERKTGKSALLVYNEDARAAIRFYLDVTGIIPQPDDYVFPSTKHAANGSQQPVDPDNMGKTIKAAAKACGIPFNVCTHSLRKTFGYRLYKNTGDIALVQYVLNHSSTAMTLRYIGIDCETITEAHQHLGNTLPDSFYLKEVIA